MTAKPPDRAPVISITLAASGCPSTAPATGAVLGQLSPQWSQVFGALDELRTTLSQRNLLAVHPAVAHDMVALHAALEGLRENALFEEFWRAQLERMAKANPDIKALPVPPEALGAGSVYAHQSPPAAGHAGGVIRA